MLEINSHITPTLLLLKNKIGYDYLFPIHVQEAKREKEVRNFVLSNFYAFCFAACLDRGTKAEIIWTIPYWMNQITGSMEPNFYYKRSIEEISDDFSKLPYQPRYRTAAPKTIQSLTKIVVEEFNDHAKSMWENKPASEVKRTFMRIYGVGKGISSMVLLLLESAYNFTFSDLDHSKMDIKADVHTKRILYRLGISSSPIDDDAAIKAGRALNPSFPGEIDGPLWYIGRNWCQARNPQCNKCVMENICPKIMRGQ